jgi:hypothetical protein
MTSRIKHLIIIVLALVLTSGWSICKGASVSDPAKNPTVKVFEFRVSTAIPGNKTSIEFLSVVDEATHAPAFQASSATFAVVIFFLNTTDDNSTFFSENPGCHNRFHKILFRSIISPNAP